jgi:MscS family membrane protein
LSSVFLKLAKLLNLVLLMLIALRLVQIFVQFATRFTEQTSSKLDEQLMPIVRTLLQGVIIIIAIIQALRLLQVDVTALIAGISIGGLALALAAQDTVKNLIGSATIFTDQPFQIGDWIEGSGFSGTVVEVGFRTTRIRRPDSSIIAVPNGAIVNMNVQNLGMREYRLLDTTIGLTYDTPPDLIEAYIQGLHRIVEVHPLANDEGAYIYLSQLADSSLNIFFRVPINTNDYNEDLKSKHEILLAVIRLAERLGVSFAFPSTSVYVESTPQKGLAPRPDGKEATRQIEEFIEELKKLYP